MSIQNQIDRLDGIKAEIKTAIWEKGVKVPPGATLADCPGLIRSIKVAPDYHTYGVKIDKKNSNPETAVTYIEEATGMTPGMASWQDTPLFAGIRPCVVKDGVVSYYLNRNDLTKKEDGSASVLNSETEGDVMVEIPKMGYQLINDSDYQYVRITTEPNKPGYCYRAHSLDSEGDCDNIYVGAFLGWQNGSKLYSLSGKSPTTDTSLTNFRSYAQARGVGYQLFSFYPLTLLQCLYLLRYKNRNSQAAIGQGWTNMNSKINTGGTVSAGEDFGEPRSDRRMCFLNVEDFWGNVGQWIDGLYTNRSMDITTAFNNFNDSGSGYPFKTASGASYNLSGYISEVQGTNDGGFIVKSVDSFSSSGSSDYADNGYIGGGCCGDFGGCWSDGDSAGAFCIQVSLGASITNSRIGSRLVYKHKGVQ